MGISGIFGAIREWLPRGSLLKDEEWERRHRALVILLWVHAAFVFGYGIFMGYDVSHVALEASVLAVSALAAMQPGTRARRSGWATFGLLMSSALLVHLSGGLIESHFHFFVMIGLLSLYQDWYPFLLSISFVVVHHGLIGILDPKAVFNHSGAWQNPWKWAAIHGAFVLAASVAYVVSWRANEKLRQEAEDSYRQLRSSEERFRSLVQHAPDAIALIGPNSEIAYMSESVRGVLGYEPDQLSGSVGIELAHPDDLERVTAVLQELAGAPGGFAVVEARALHADGRYRWLECRLTNLIDDANIGGIVVNFRDIDERKKLESKLTHQAFHDPLTGLPNRLFFMERVRSALSRVRRIGKPAAVLFVDLDRFKPINDTLGHEFGDAVLIEVGRRLEGAIRSVDTAARLGGDEFAVLLEDVDKDHVYVAVDRICAELTAPIDVGGRSLDIGASAGICVSRNGTETASDLIRNADIAMYISKSRGSGRVEIFQPSMLSAGSADGNGQAANKAAIIQPVMDLETGRVAGLEEIWPTGSGGAEKWRREPV